MTSLGQVEAEYDLLILGSGAAGLTVALRVAESAPGLSVALATKGLLASGSTPLAQGGIAAVTAAADSVDDHIADTTIAGAGLGDPAAMRLVAERAGGAIDWLVRQGTCFDRAADGTGYHLTREGGHSHRRILHAADATGRAVVGALTAQLQASGVAVLEHHAAIDLVLDQQSRHHHRSCRGVYLLDATSGRIRAVSARSVVLATGGASQAYLHSSNPDSATGDGIAMAWRAGCRIANMEFTQFHPTCLYLPQQGPQAAAGVRATLISEALRGEGGVLVRPDGSRFMPAYDPRAELAPRDIVARAIDEVMKREGHDCLYLDISHQPAEFIREHFPTIWAACLAQGIDITCRPIPIVPAAHYTCGGVVTDLLGRTDLAQLYAVGETACTGLHGANRLASNSLLECIVFGLATAADIVARLPHAPPCQPIAAWDDSRMAALSGDTLIRRNRDLLRRCLWAHVGIRRSTTGLHLALQTVRQVMRETADLYRQLKMTTALLELRNLALVADLITRSALARQECRGAHYVDDYADRESTVVPRDTILQLNA